MANEAYHPGRQPADEYVAEWPNCGQDNKWQCVWIAVSAHPNQLFRLKFLNAGCLKHEKVTAAIPVRTMQSGRYYPGPTSGPGHPEGGRPRTPGHDGVASKTATKRKHGNSRQKGPRG
jgi:hypothetical protein